ncbi:unnamed protein product, partial [Meganyctiphanes norvegica]
MTSEMAPLSDTEEEIEPENQPLLGTDNQMDTLLESHIEREIVSDEENIPGERAKRRTSGPANTSEEQAQRRTSGPYIEEESDSELQPFLNVDTDAKPCRSIQNIQDEKPLEIEPEKDLIEVHEWVNISKEGQEESPLKTKNISQLTGESETEYCKVLEIGSDPIAENLYKLEMDNIENNSNNTLSLEDNALIASNIISHESSSKAVLINDLIDLSAPNVESNVSNKRPISCHVLDGQKAKINIDRTKENVVKRTMSCDVMHELPNIPICDIESKDNFTLQKDQKEIQHKEEFIIIDSKTIDTGNSEIIKETSFISKEIQEQISKANSTTSLPISLQNEAKNKNVGVSISDDPIVSYSNKRLRQRQGRKPGAALRIISKDEKITEIDKSSETISKIESFIVDSTPSTSKEHKQSIKDYEHIKNPSQLVKASSCDSAESATALNIEDDGGSSHSIEALSLSPSKKRKRRKISVPFIKTSDGTIIKFFSDASMYLMHKIKF